MMLSQQLRQPTDPQFCSNSSIRASSETGEVWDGPVDSDGSLDDSYGSKGAYWIPGHARSQYFAKISSSAADPSAGAGNSLLGRWGKGGNVRISAREGGEWFVTLLGAD